MVDYYLKTMKDFPEELDRLIFLYEMKLEESTELDNFEESDIYFRINSVLKEIKRQYRQI